jgi:hypothetical protein
MTTITHGRDLNAAARRMAAKDAGVQHLVDAARPKLEGKSVLMIGDSHTAGAFGERFDALLRASGATTRSYGTSSSSPDWWVSGKTAAMGNAVREKGWQVFDGKPWNTSRATPKLSDLIKGGDKPDVLVVAMGANFRGASPAKLKSEVDDLAVQAQRAGIKLVWIGPPRTAKDIGNPKSIQAFDANMKAALGDRGTYVPSSGHTTHYSGGDGVHYNGEKGTALANSWAAGVFSDFAKGL